MELVFIYSLCNKLFTMQELIERNIKLYELKEEQPLYREDGKQLYLTEFESFISQKVEQKKT